MCLASGHMENLKQVIESINADFKKVSEMVSKYDNEVNCLYHEIETGKFNAAEGYKKMKQLQTTLRKRRMVKHEYTRLHSATQTLNLTVVNNALHKALQNVNRLSDKNASYTDGWEVSFADLVAEI